MAKQHTAVLQIASGIVKKFSLSTSSANKRRKTKCVNSKEILGRSQTS